MKKRMTPPGTAAAPHKNGKGKFALRVGTWAWNKFKTKARWLTRVNHFTFEESSLMEAAALEKLLEKDFAKLASTAKDPEGYVYSAINNALTNAAQKIADDRRLWGRAAGLSMRPRAKGRTPARSAISSRPTAISATRARHSPSRVPSPTAGL